MHVVDDEESLEDFSIGRIEFTQHLAFDRVGHKTDGRDSLIAFQFLDETLQLLAGQTGNSVHAPITSHKFLSMLMACFRLLRN